MDKDIRLLERQVEALEKRLTLYENDGPMAAYYALNRIVNMQVEFLRKFDLNAHIGSESKEDKIYDRSEKMWKALPELAADLEGLKAKIKATDNEVEDMKAAAGSFMDKFAHAR